MHAIVYAIVKNMIKSKTLTKLIQIVHSRFLSALIVAPGLHPLLTTKKNSLLHLVIV